MPSDKTRPSNGTQPKDWKKTLTKRFILKKVKFLEKKTDKHTWTPHLKWMIWVGGLILLGP